MREVWLKHKVVLGTAAGRRGGCRSLRSIFILEADFGADYAKIGAEFDGGSVVRRGRRLLVEWGAVRQTEQDCRRTRRYRHAVWQAGLTCRRMSIIIRELMKSLLTNDGQQRIIKPLEFGAQARRHGGGALKQQFAH